MKTPLGVEHCGVGVYVKTKSIKVNGTLPREWASFPAIPVLIEKKEKYVFRKSTVVVMENNKAFYKKVTSYITVTASGLDCTLSMTSFKHTSILQDGD